MHLYGIKTCTVKVKYKSRSTITEIKFVIWITGSTEKNYKRNQGISGELQTKLVLNQVLEYKNKCTCHIDKNQIK